MSYKCNFCDNKFVQNISLKKHLSDKRCKSLLFNDKVKCNELINNKQKIFDKEILNKDILIQQFKKEIDELKEKIAINIW